MVGPLGRTIWQKRSETRRQGLAVSRLTQALAAYLLFITPAGCIGVNARDARLRNAVEDGWERIEASRGLNVSLETGAVLARQRLLVEAQEDPASAARLLETRLQSQTDPDGTMALAELSYHVGVDRQTKSPVAAMTWCRDAAILAALALGDPSTSRPDLATDIHNRAVARLIRVAQTRLAREGGNRSWLQVLTAQGLVVHSSTMYLAPSGLATWAWRAISRSRAWITFIDRAVWECR